MMYIDDCIDATIKFLKADKERLTRTCYNLAGISFTPEELSEAVQTLIPGTKIEYEPDYRQNIANSWPRSIDDRESRADWDWSYDISTQDLAAKILNGIEPKYKQDLFDRHTGMQAPAELTF